VRVFAVWQPILITDWRRPTSSVLARLHDPRAAQYWDANHALARRMSADARDPQPKEDCCRRDDILWDLAAVYPPGAKWDDKLPPAVFFNGSVVDSKDQLDRSLQ
jgi:hypothetical protein